MYLRIIQFLTKMFIIVFIYVILEVKTIFRIWFVRFFLNPA